MKCIYCFRKQRNKENFLLWKTIFSIKIENGLYFFTVCPHCLNLPIGKIYERLITHKDLFYKRLL